MDKTLNIWRLVFEASPVVQLVMLILVAASLYSLALMWDKSRSLRRNVKRADRFEKDFWAGGDLSLIYKKVAGRGEDLTGIEAIFDAGFKEFAKLKNAKVKAEDIIQGAARAMRVAQMREIESMERNLATLATVGSISPYVGLFGTVVGIINAFTSLGALKQATLATVAPGIAEALIATALGLVAAIPAVIAYNRFADTIDRLERRFTAFNEEFIAVLQRYVHVDQPLAA